MKKLIKHIICFLIVLGMVFLTGCTSTYERCVERELKKKYSEDFTVVGINTGSYGGGRYSALVSPVANPDVIFEVDMLGKKMYDENSDDYPSRYTSKLITEYLKDDLEEFFPNAYFFSHVVLSGGGKIRNVKGMTLDDIFDIADAETSEMTLYIFYDEETGTAQKYEEEFEYFTETINEYIKNKRAVPVTVAIYKVDSEALENVERFYKYGISMSLSDRKRIYGVDYEMGIFNENGTDVGSPPNIAACFDEGWPAYLDDVQEYIRRRELLEEATIKYRDPD
jgi:hypothetical protein